MKKKVWLITAVVCVLLGGGLFFVGRAMGGKGIVFDFSEKEKFKLIGELKEYSFADMDYEAFKSVLIDVPECDIYIEHSDNGKFGIDMRLYSYSDDDIDFEVYKSEGEQIGNLLIKNSSETPKISFNFYINYSQYIKLYLPDGDYDYIRAGTHDSDIVIKDVSTKNEIVADCKNGSITFTGVSGEKVSANTSNANITFKNVSGNSVSANTSNADVDMESIDATELKLETSNGEAELINVSADNISAKTSNGDIDFDNVRGADAVLKTSNSDIIMDNVEFANSIDAETSNSDINLTLIGKREDFTYDIKTSNSQINIDGHEYGTRYTNGDGQPDIKLVTSDGDVTVDFKASR